VADCPAHARTEVTDLQRQAAHLRPCPAAPQHVDTSLVCLSDGGQAEPNAVIATTGMTHDAFQGIRNGLASFRIEDARRLKRELLVICG
jgi:hypothetical protein